jgi:hypothetical protein
MTAPNKATAPSTTIKPISGNMWRFLQAGDDSSNTKSTAIKITVSKIKSLLSAPFTSILLSELLLPTS